MVPWLTPNSSANSNSLGSRRPTSHVPEVILSIIAFSVAL